MTTRASRGMETVTSLRLCSRAPLTTISDWRLISPLHCREANGRSCVSAATSDAGTLPAHGRRLRTQPLQGRAVTGWARVGQEARAAQLHAAGLPDGRGRPAGGQLPAAERP